MYSALPDPVSGRAKPHSNPPVVSLSEMVWRSKVIPVPGWVNESWAKTAGTAVVVRHGAIRNWSYCGLTKSGQQRSCLESGEALHLQLPAPQRQDKLDGIPGGEESSRRPLTGPMPSYVAHFILFAFTPDSGKRLGCGVHLGRDGGVTTLAEACCTSPRTRIAAISCPCQAIPK